MIKITDREYRIKYNFGFESWEDKKQPYSFTDHLVLDCLSEIQRYLGESMNYHYTILKKEKDVYICFK